ncbi:hypothetical protein TPHA_0K02270 [Tetrapisispora phaffii CBS 4417]|uniref:Uncharacterized protein n=1 Tax=Tetrapisispora phaffii (strain ATCC 24235 / CBS 4417 / NBRC 1672 / NRRL Y-8282 / UCD 70-5) TaxID=1071381 RepID=G8BZM9_TETPH|nr:hypothetical protein TPHA_0K02270 [Tetrapisispora phaffii CBS 4417]CCE65357.1 hypothetical protein TPHA_0K02270 [Tetrapisispora phaffii CBS 4417]
MLEQAEYRRQLKALSFETIWEQNGLDRDRLLQVCSNNDCMSIKIKPTNSRFPHPSPNRHRANLSHIDIKITYSRIYNEPVLYLRLWKSVPCSMSPDLEELSPYYPSDVYESLAIDKSQFTVELQHVECDAGANEVWYCVHPCDTQDRIGMLHREQYLSRWVSVYLLSWLPPAHRS